MKSKIFFISVCLLFAMQTVAQKFDNFDFEKIKAKKIAYLTDAISLTPAEAEKFWPVYNELEQKRFQLMMERHSLEEKLEQKIDDMSDEKYTELTKKMTSFQKADGDLAVEYNEKFLKILPPKKVVKLYVAERGFRGFLLREYRKGEPEPQK